AQRPQPLFRHEAGAPRHLPPSRCEGRGTKGQALGQSFRSRSHHRLAQASQAVVREGGQSSFRERIERAGLRCGQPQSPPADDRTKARRWWHLNLARLIATHLQVSQKVSATPSLANTARAYCRGRLPKLNRNRSRPPSPLK